MDDKNFTKLFMSSFTPSELHNMITSALREVIEALPHPQAVNAEPTDKLLNIREAAEFLSLTVPTMYSKVSKGELPVMKKSKRLYFSKTELTEYVKTGRKLSNNEVDAEAEKYLNNRQ